MLKSNVANLINDLHDLEVKYNVSLINAKLKEMIEPQIEDLNTPALPEAVRRCIIQQEYMTGYKFTGTTLEDAIAYLNASSNVPTVKQMDYVRKIGDLLNLDYSYIKTKSQASNFIESNKHTYRVVRSLVSNYGY